MEKRVAGGINARRRLDAMVSRRCAERRGTCVGKQGRQGKTGNGRSDPKENAPNETIREQFPINFLSNVLRFSS
ncbi:hypothetical protein GALL_290080 [mine drainage metagenome]|uniref:Uncharacterized protein n=1 Tax=mine drainage metagenome TaxID=410659 RepID=A0A1J5RAP6_9ZZZZ